MESTGDVVRRAITRFQQVQQIMADAAKVRQEYYDLQSFLRQAHNLFPDAFELWPLPGMDGSPPGNIQVQVSDKVQIDDGVAVDSKSGGLPTKRGTSDYAEWALKVHGSMHIRDILRRMRDEGWKGNPDDAIAKKTLFNVMNSHKDTFENQGRNVWALKKQEVDW